MLFPPSPPVLKYAWLAVLDPAAQLEHPPCPTRMMTAYPRPPSVSTAAQRAHEACETAGQCSAARVDQGLEPGGLTVAVHEKRVDAIRVDQIRARWRAAVRLLEQTARLLNGWRWWRGWHRRRRGWDGTEKHNNVGAVGALVIASTEIVVVGRVPRGEIAIIPAICGAASGAAARPPVIVAAVIRVRALIIVRAQREPCIGRWSVPIVPLTVGLAHTTLLHHAGRREGYAWGKLDPRIAHPRPRPCADLVLGIAARVPQELQTKPKAAQRMGRSFGDRYSQRRYH